LLPPGPPILGGLEHRSSSRMGGVPGDSRSRLEAAPQSPLPASVYRGWGVPSNRRGGLDQAGEAVVDVGAFGGFVALEGRKRTQALRVGCICWAAALYYTSKNFSYEERMACKHLFQAWTRIFLRS
jgi:hypothetical protein